MISLSISNDLQITTPIVQIPLDYQIIRRNIDHDKIIAYGKIIA